MKRYLIILLVILGYKLFACEQADDKIFYNNKEMHLSLRLQSSPLEHFLKQTFSRSPFNDYLNTRLSTSTGLHRGYIAEWKIKKNKLYLTDIKVGHTGLPLNLKTMFKKVKKGMIQAKWFSGQILVTPGRFEYGTKYIITVENGEITKTQELYNTRHSNMFNYEKLEKTDTAIKELYKRSRETTPMIYRTDDDNIKLYDRVCAEIREIAKQDRENKSNREKKMHARIDSYNVNSIGYDKIDEFLHISLQRIYDYKPDSDIDCVFTQGKLSGISNSVHFYWRNPIINEKPQYTWNNFTDYVDELNYCLEKNSWFTKLVKEHGWRLELTINGTFPDVSWKSYDYWNKAGLSGKPDISLLIRWGNERFDDEMGYIHFSSNESIVLIEPKKPHNYQHKKEFFELIPYYKKVKPQLLGDEFYLVDYSKIPKNHKKQ